MADITIARTYSHGDGNSKVDNMRLRRGHARHGTILVQDTRLHGARHLYVLIAPGLAEQQGLLTPTTVYFASHAPNS